MSTYTPISSFTATTSISSVTIAGIPQNYTDLVLVGVNGNAVNSDNDIYIRFNSDSGSNYSRTQMVGNGSNASSSRTSNNTEIRIGPSYNNTPTSTLISHIMNYSNTTTYKTVLSRTGHASGYVMGHVALWRSTAAITSITLTLQNSESFVTGSTFNLYGIDAQASAQAKATGGSSITTDGTYWYHTFLSSGTFTPTENLTADYLVVAGGGGGGNTVSYTFTSAGGGGAGGLRSTVTATGGGGSLESALSLTAQAYTVTVGAGGAGATTFRNRGATGSNSVFSTITSNGGGGGAGNGDEIAGSANGGNGGSGGGAMSVATNTGSGGTPQSGQGFRGGNGIASYSQGAGGGGAGAIGGDQVSGGAKNGGAGVAVAITGSSVTYAGGGGGGGYYLNQAGGSGGAGGGGNGATAVNGGTANPAAQAGGTNLGGGGGGGSSQQGGTAPGGNGGSGIVIVRYSV